MRLYYAPGRCSLAAHIVLEEIGAPYQLVELERRDGDFTRSDFLEVNPRAQVPVLELDDAIIVENVAIQFYLASRFPEANLAPLDLVERARWISVNTWFSNTVHPSYLHRPDHYAPDEHAQDSIRVHARAKFWRYLEEINQMLDDRTWIHGDQYTTSDPYPLVFYSWARNDLLPVHELTNYTKFKDRMLERTAVRTVLHRERSPLS